MKVLFINYEFPPIGGGGGRATWQIARRLVRRGHPVRVLTSLYGALPHEELREGVHLHRIAVRRTRPEVCSPRELLSFILRSIPAARQLADAFRPDVACAFFAVPGGPAAWRLRRSRGVPYVLALRGSDIPRPQLSRYQRLHVFTRPFIRRILRNAAAVTAVCNDLREAALALEPCPHISVIPNGVDTEIFHPLPRLIPPPQRRELLFVGRLREFKGVQHVIRALPMIERELGHPVRLTVVGDGPYRETLVALADAQRKNGAASEVRFMGWLEQEALRDIYVASSLLLLPSLVEGHPNVLLEGMASGLPYVASDVPGIREAVTRDAGILTPPEDPREIAGAVSRVLSDAGRWRAMSRAARAWAASFSWDRVAEVYESVLAQAAKRGGPA